MQHRVHRFHFPYQLQFCTKSQTLQQLFTCSKMQKEIAECTQIQKSKEDTLNLFKQHHLQLQNNCLHTNNQVIFNSYYMEQIIKVGRKCQLSLISHLL